MIRIKFQREDCIGCYYYSDLAPYRWEMDEDDGRSVLVDGVQKGEFFFLDVGDDELDDAEEATDNCPAGVIQFEKR